MKIDCNELSRDSQVILWLLVAANELRKKGLVVGDFEKVTAEGLAVYRQLQESGFEPTADEMAWGMAALGAERAPAINSEASH